MLFCIQRQFDHAFKQFVRLQPREILAHEFLAKQAANIAQLAAFVFAGINKVSVSVVDDNHVLLLIVS